MTQGHKEHWPTTLDINWFEHTIVSLRDHCRQAIAHAKSLEGYMEVQEAFAANDPAIVNTPHIPFNVYLSGQGYLRSAGYFGEQGLEFIIKKLNELYPDENDPVVKACIEPMDRNVFFRHVLAPLITVAMVQQRDGVSWTQAMETILQSCICGVVHFPVIGEVAVEQADLLKGKSVDPREYGRPGVKEEEDIGVVFCPDGELPSFIDEEGNEVIVIG
ncbi:hypothetical protein JB92DRAFT_3122465 [Gautieria morchelliformis]|nr:hypothetical protein JB92DRAFT_3122465 [Gautieria morchelliformis]